MKELELLSSSIVLREREVLAGYRDRLEQVDLEDSGRYENKGLLDSSSDDSDEEVKP